MSSDSTVKILRKGDVKESDQLVEDVKGVVGEDDPFGLRPWRIDVNVMKCAFEKAAKVPAGVGVGK